MSRRRRSPARSLLQPDQAPKDCRNPECPRPKGAMKVIAEEEEFATHRCRNCGAIQVRSSSVAVARAREANLKARQQRLLEAARTEGGKPKIFT